jgi:hypothetical protein
VSDLLDDIVTKLTANHFDYHREGANVPAIVIPVPVRPIEQMTGRGAPEHASGNYVVVDNDGLKLLFYPGTTWTAGDYDDEANASAAAITETRQVISALYDFGRPLNQIMEFDHVIEVKANGLIVDRLGVYAPDLRNGELETSAIEEGWSLMAGYTGQQGGGDIMHNSEFIGGGMEQDIRETPGIYVALVCYWDPEEDEDEDDGDPIEGWAVATMEVTE